MGVLQTTAEIYVISIIFIYLMQRMTANNVLIMQISWSKLIKLVLSKEIMSIVAEYLIKRITRSVRMNKVENENVS